MKINNPSIIERGKRLRLLRRSIGMSIEDFANLTKISKASISYWENANYRGLTKKAAEKIIDALKSADISCDINWLLYDENNNLLNQTLLNYENNKSLNSSNNSHSLNKDLISNSSITGMHKEIDIFLSMNKNSVITKISENLMEPVFKIGDIVGGIWENIDQLETDTNCIISKNNKLYVRKITSNFKISCFNPNGKETIDFSSLDEKFTIAPIIRFWSWR